MRRAVRGAAYAVGLCLAAATWAGPGQSWTEGFEEGVARARPYHKAAPQSVLEAMSGDAPEGAAFIRATLPGERPLEGFSVAADGLDGGRVAQVSAQVRGRGAIWLCLHSGNGWLYSPKPVPLTGDWQPVRLDKVLRKQDSSLGVFFISKTAQPGAVFEVDAVRVEMAAAPRVYDAAVDACRFEAEQFAAQAGCVTSEPSASGAAVAAHQDFVALAGLPFPRTARPVTVAVRVRLDAEQAELRLITRQGGHRQALSALAVERTGAWRWERFPAATAGEVGDAYGIELACEGLKAGASALDAVVIGTDERLEPAALDAAPAAFAGFPLVSVLRCESPPALDGKGDDACWAGTVACTGFSVVRSSIRPEATTTVRLCYDDENLYALFTCEEPILDVRSQRTHEFHAEAREHDHGVSSDACCLLLLDPARAGRDAFDLFVNALGTIEDARCSAPNLWASRDLAWDSGARAAGQIDDGAYTVEVAVPFAGLSGTAPGPGETWHACLGRVAKTRNEVSAWNPCVAGLHEPDPWGALVFLEAAPGVALDPPASLSPGANALAAQIAPRADGTPGGVLLMSRIGAGATWASRYAFAEAAAGPTEALLPFHAPQEGELRVVYGALDAATLRPLCLTPVAARSVRSATAKVRLACDGPYALHLNDEVVGRGPATDGDAFTVPLRKGMNVFALDVEQGTAAIALEPPGWLPDRPIRWKIAPPGASGATASATDDGAWDTAGRVGEHATLGAVIGKPGGAAVLRHTLLWEETRVWPTPNPALYIARGSAQHVNIMAEGLKGRRLRDWAVYLAVPEEFEVLGATGYYGNTVEAKARWTCTPMAVQNVDGARMRVVRIAADKPVTVRSGHAILRLFNVFVRCPEQAASMDEIETRFAFWAEGNDGTLTEPPQSVPVRTLPPLNGRQPKHMTWQLWGSFFNAMDDEASRIATLELARAAGINDLVAGDAWTSEHAAAYGMRHTACVNFQSWSLGIGAYLADHPAKRRLDADGTPDDGYPCMTALLDEAWPAVVEKLAAKLERDRPDVLDYDYEYPPFGPPHACFCERCLAAFRERAGLSAEIELTPALVKERYEAQWVDFMAWRVAVLFRKLKDEIGRIAPGTEFSAYSGYQSEQNPLQYGVDWRYVGQLGACDAIGCGYGRPADRIAMTIEAARGIPTVFGALHHPHDTMDTAPPMPFTKARLLRRALDATGGLLLYDRLPLDGRSWQAIAETTRLAAAHEPVFLQGERRALPGLDDAEVQLAAHGATTLICVMNHSREEKTWTIPLPAGKGAGTEFYSGAPAAAGERVTCTLAPGETAVYVFGG
ncbi:MAG: hypothetical protein JXR94_08180 [Candidatus Hydrogenedentes bacterium]|nr:hypothetical protein [Candidatus Hydrogenedentota bacterium]